MTSLMIQPLRRLGRPALFRVSGSAVLLACVGVALALGVVASSAISPAPSFAGPKSYATGRFPVALAVADVNGDGRPDLATANYGEGANSVSVLVNRGDGSFGAGSDYVVGEAPGSLAIGDLNGDRKPDLSVANEVTNSVSVLLNNGDGTFVQRRDYPTGPVPLSVAIGDLNGDGSRDLAIANFVVSDVNIVSVPGTVSVLLNSGDGGFQPKVDYPTGRRPQEVVIGDLTGDGKPDLATGNRSDTVSVLANNGNGTFESPVDHRAGSGPRAIAIGDLSGDGRLDLATANTNHNVNTVSVLINRGRGTFRAKRDYRAGNGPFSVAIGDVDGDGSRDLAAADVSGNGVSVFVNKGNGSFLPRRDYRTGREPWSVAIADLTGDGRRDLATANHGANSVSVLANTTGLCSVPKVTGMTLPTAKRTIVRANCHVRTVRSAYSKTVKRGRVISQKPKPGAVLLKGGKVNLVVSRGRKPARLLGFTYFPGARVHTALLRNSILNTERGAVEAWYRQESDPVPFKHNPHRIFGGPYSLTAPRARTPAARAAGTRKISGRRDPPSRPARRPHPRVLQSSRLRRDTNNGALQGAWGSSARSCGICKQRHPLGELDE